MTQRTRAVIWDMDGVIVDTAPFHFQAWQKLCQEHNIPFTEDDFNRTFGMRNQEIIETFFGKDTSRTEMSRLAERKEQLFRQAIQGRIQPLPGALELLRSLGGTDCAQALASSAPLANIRLILDSLGIGHFFDVIVSDADVRVGKPDPEMFLLAAKRLNLPPECCVVVEDSVAGVRAAKAASMRCIAVTNTHPPERLAQADLVVSTLEEVDVTRVANL